VPEQDLYPRQALKVCGAHIVCAQHVDGAGTGHARNVAEAGQAHCDGGQDQRWQCLAEAAVRTDGGIGRQHREGEREERDEQERGDELRQADEGHRDCGDSLIHQFFAVECSQHAERNAERHV